tara:strand:+ start:180 stop:671 length:492 start_codon:yes stop_codon:yes gene_type:complete
MILTEPVYNVLNHKKNFDFIFLGMLKNNNQEDAYDAALDIVREYAPNFKHYKDFDSYRVILANSQDRGPVLSNYKPNLDIPVDVIDAICKGIDELFHKHLKRVKVRKMAYDACVKEINIYFPHYKPHKNYQSYKASESIRHKNKLNDKFKNNKKPIRKVKKTL